VVAGLTGVPPPFAVFFFFFFLTFMDEIARPAPEFYE